MRAQRRARNALQRCRSSSEKHSRRRKNRTRHSAVQQDANDVPTAATLVFISLLSFTQTFILSFISLLAISFSSHLLFFVDIDLPFFIFVISPSSRHLLVSFLIHFHAYFSHSFLYIFFTSSFLLSLISLIFPTPHHSHHHSLYHIHPIHPIPPSSPLPVCGWWSLTRGVCVCACCGGAHRALDGARVRSLTLDTSVWDKDNVDLACAMGNTRVNEILGNKMVSKDADMYG